MIPKVDSEKCIGCGACVAIAGNTFKLNAEGKSEVINPTGDTPEVIQQAVEGCPVGAITLE